MKNIEIGPYQDRERRTCLVIGHSSTSVELIQLDTSSGLRVSEATENSFSKNYKYISGYPLHKAIEQYIEFATYCGMSEQVKSVFHDMLTGISKKEKIDMSLALAKLEGVKILSSINSRAKTSKTKTSKMKPRGDDVVPWEDDYPSKGKNQKAGKQAETQMQIKDAKGTGKKVKKGTSESSKGFTKVAEKTTKTNTDGLKAGKTSAAQMFRDLILSGSYDDDTIFRMVKQEFNLDDSKRSYVSYYRRELKNKGLL